MAISKTNKTKTQAWAFIDTNIYLDFYRSNNEARLQLLDKIKKSSDRIISTYQIQMEFLKHRQTELLKTVTGLKISNSPIPAVVSDGHILSYSKKIIEFAEKRDKSLKKMVERMLSQPKTHDKVFQVLDTIFSSNNSHVLTRDMDIRQSIKRLAWRRFILGYPPRKKNETSIGDALNWEWIVYCANKLELKGSFYIVSRDSDYGKEFNNKNYINDQLKSEFRNRVGGKSIILTNKLSDVLKALEVNVTPDELKAEEEIIKPKFSEKPEQSDDFSIESLQASGFDRKTAERLSYILS